MIKITFLGTGTSMGVPVAGGFGQGDIKPDPRNTRWRCSAWIETEETSVVIDTGPEFRLQTLRAGIQHIDLVLITHEHMDHLGGLDDLRPFCYQQNERIPVYTTRDSIAAIKSRFEYMFGDNRYPGAAALDLHELTDSIDCGDVTIIPLPAMHGAVHVLGYRLNDVSYFSDVKVIPPETKQKIKGSNMLVLDGLRWEPDHPTHMTIPQAVEMATELEIPQTYLVHMNGSVNHTEINARLPDHVQLAYDQLTVEIHS